MPIQFDPANRRIILDTASVTATELWSRWIDWAASSDNGKYLPAMRQVGGDVLSGAQSIPPYIFLLNGWRVRPMEASHLLVIDGNLFAEGSDKPVVSTLGNFNVSVQYTVPVQAQAINISAASAAISDTDTARIASAVWTRIVESGMTAEQLLRLLIAQAAGDAEGLEGPTTVFKSLDGQKNRIVGTIAAGTRNVTGIDGT